MIVGQNALINQFVPPFRLEDLADGQILIYNSATKSFINGNNSSTQALNTKTVNVAYEVTFTDEFICVSTATGNITITLPSNPTDGEYHIFKKVSTDLNTLTIDGNGKTIDDSATFVTNSNSLPSVYIVYNKSLDQWFIV